MTTEELAAALNGRQYGDEMTRAEELCAKESGIVVVFGASDDLMEFRGAVNDELSAWGGTEAYLTNAGLLTNDCDNEECPYFKKLMNAVPSIEAIWNAGGYSWIYTTTIPHAEFDVLEDGDKYCRGIVFSLSDIPPCK